MVLAIAFESMVKLLAFLAVGAFVTFGLYNGFDDLFSKAQLAPRLEGFWNETINWPSMVVQTGVAMMAIICLPRQFHVTVVENIEPQDLRLARWVFPMYLILAALFVVPIALAGQMLLPGVIPDSYVISLPLAEAHPALALLAFIGGASAATGMVIVEAVALSTMVSNDMLLPWLLRRNNAERPFEVFRHWMLSVRRVTIVVILLLAYVSYRLLGSTASLATIGQIAFAAITQLTPAMLGALYWKQANRRGVFAGLAAGIFLWFYTLVLPIAAHSLGWSLDLFPGLAWLHGNPLNLPITPLTQGVVLSLAGNFTLFAWVSILSRTRVSEHWQAGRFIGQQTSARPNSRSLLAVQIDDLLQLAARFVGEERARQSFIRFAYRQGKGFNPNQNADGDWIEHTERLLAGVLGTSSTRAVVKAAIEGRDMQLEDVVRIADEASEVLQFNRALLQGAIENISQGISVVDQNLLLVAWNRRYLELFNYPDGLISVGRPIADIIRYNAERGLCGPGEAQVHVARRLHWMRQGRAHTSERLFPNGRVIELIGNPMPGGGFVMSFTDITPFREAEQALKEANEGLEQRVAERTQELSQLNQALTEAKSHAESANQSKTRFLAAVSHDLMQPLNAARLFSAALSHQGDGLSTDAQQLVQHMDSSLRSAEELISDLLDISRLENGKITPDPKPFALNELFDTLGAEFKVLAQQQGLDFRLRGSRLRVHSDMKLLRRILQNFLTNAFRYGKSPILLGVRRDGGKLWLEVWDRGPGIADDKLQVIFEEFKRLDSHQTRAEKGLGLGLAIADGLCRVLGHSLEVRSWPGKGSVFRVSVPLATTPVATLVTPAEQAGQPLAGMQVLCVDNEDSILIGMNSLLSRWGCQVWTARNRDECDALLKEGMRPHLALVDFHLDDGETGTELMAWLRTRLGEPVPGVVISADGHSETVAQVHAAGLDFLAKPVKPAALRALLNRHLSLVQ
ncbi:Non-motile and phage-resistance protein [compost metagenome]